MVGFTPPPPYPLGKRPRDPMDSRLGGIRSWIESGGEEEENLSPPPAGIRTTVVQPVAESQHSRETMNEVHNLRFSFYVMRHFNGQHERVKC
jgi:hypothetical protein